MAPELLSEECQVAVWQCRGAVPQGKVLLSPARECQKTARDACSKRAQGQSRQCCVHVIFGKRSPENNSMLWVGTKNCVPSNEPWKYHPLHHYRDFNGSFTDWFIIVVCFFFFTSFFLYRSGFLAAIHLLICIAEADLWDISLQQGDGAVWKQPTDCNSSCSFFRQIHQTIKEASQDSDKDFCGGLRKSLKIYDCAFITSSTGPDE